MSELDSEFLPLPYYPWEERPTHLKLDDDEVATALYLTKGVLERTAERLRVDPLRLVRTINRSPHLTRLHAELTSLLNDKVHQEYVRAFDSEDDRRREWAASKVANTKAFQSHPLAPNSQTPNLLPVAAGAQRIIISWDDGSTPAPMIEHDSSE